MKHWRPKSQSVRTLCSRSQEVCDEITASPNLLSALRCSAGEAPAAPMELSAVVSVSPLDQGLSASRRAVGCRIQRFLSAWL